MREIGGIMPDMTTPEKPVSEILNRVHMATKLADKNALIGLIQEVALNPEAEAAQCLEVEVLRIESSEFFGKTKGNIGQLQEHRPALTSDNRAMELAEYEDTLSKFILDSKDTTKYIVGADDQTRELATEHALKRLVARVENWDDAGNVSKEKVQRSLLMAGLRDVSPDEMRRAISSTSAAVNETIGEIVQIGREIGAHIDEPGLLEQSQTRYDTSTTDSFMQASAIATDAIQQLAK